MRSRATSTVAITTVSTVATGLTNILLPLLVQATGTLVDLGAFAVASLPLAVVIAAGRGVLTQSVLRGWGFKEIPSLVPILTVIALLGSISIAALVLSFSLPSHLLLLSFAPPVVLLQDALRHRVFGVHRPAQAMFSDLTWLLALVAAAGALQLWTGLTPALVIVAYLVGGVLSIPPITQRGDGSGQVGDRPAPAPLRPVLAEMGLIVLIAQVSTLVVAALLPLTVVGTVRSALIALSGASVVANIVNLVLVPRLSRVSMKVSMAWAAVVTAFAGGMAVPLLLALPRELVHDVLGFQTSGGLLAAVAVGACGFGLSAAVSLAAVRIREEFAPSMWLSARLLAAITEPAITLPLAMLVGAPGLAANSLISNSIFAIDFWRRKRSLLTAARNRSRLGMVESGER